MIKNISAFVLALTILFLVIFYVSSRIYSFNGNKISSLELGGKTFFVENVSSDEKLRNGLSGREKLCASCGMLFKFKNSDRYSFWMDKMLIPIDIIWISSEKIVHIEKNIQPDFKGIMNPNNEADSVLEVNAGNVDSLSIKVGDMVKY